MKLSLLIQALLFSLVVSAEVANSNAKNEQEQDVIRAVKEDARSLWGGNKAGGGGDGRSDNGSYYVRSDERTEDDSTCGLGCSTDRDCEVDCPTCVKSTTSSKYGVCGVVEEESGGRSDTTPTCGSKCSSDVDCSTNEKDCTVCQKELNQNGKEKEFGVCAVEETSSERVDVEETEVRSDEDNCGVTCVSNRDCGGSDNVCGICQKPAASKWGSSSSSTGTCVADTNGQTWEVKDEDTSRPYYNQNKWSQWEYYNYRGTSKSSGKYKYKGGGKYKYKSGGK